MMASNPFCEPVPHSQRGSRPRSHPNTPVTKKKSTLANSPQRSGSLKIVPSSEKSTDSYSLTEDLENSTNAKRFIDELKEEIETSCDNHRALETPIIAVTKGNYQRVKSKRKKEQLLAVLTYHNIEDIDRQSSDGMTALHLAVENHDYSSAEILVAFGADVNIIDNQGLTPLDLLTSDPDVSHELETPVYLSSPTRVLSRNPSAGSVAAYEERKKLIDLLTLTGAVSGDGVEKHTRIDEVKPFPCIPKHDNDSERVEEQWLKWNTTITMQFTSLSEKVRRLSTQSSELTIEETLALGSHLRELQFLKKAGSRVLFLDGGGIKGLIQIEILSQLEKQTGRKVTELFDWIVGASTGGIIALGLVYAKKSLAQLRQLYFKLKDDVFGKARAGASTDVTRFEEILKEELGEDICMDHVTYPHVMIAAVEKKHTNPKLRFFNNCFSDYYHKRDGITSWPIWKVARYTSAAPWLFGECDDFVDGGVLANNPCVDGFTRIEEYYSSMHMKLPISLVVSVGSGLIPDESLGSINAQAILLFFTQGWMDGTAHVRGRVRNLKTLILNALTDTEKAVDNCRSRCAAQDVPFFRLNSHLRCDVSSKETNIDVLLNMMTKTIKEVKQLTELKDLVKYLNELSSASNKVLPHLVQ